MNSPVTLFQENLLPMLHLPWTVFCSLSFPSHFTFRDFIELYTMTLMMLCNGFPFHCTPVPPFTFWVKWLPSFLFLGRLEAVTQFGCKQGTSQVQRTGEYAHYFTPGPVAETFLSSFISTVIGWGDTELGETWGGSWKGGPRQECWTPRLGMSFCTYYEVRNIGKSFHCIDILNLCFKYWQIWLAN